MDRKTGEFENGRWRAGAQGLYAEYGNRVLLKHLSLNAGTFYSKRKQKKQDEFVTECRIWLERECRIWQSRERESLELIR